MPYVPSKLNPNLEVLGEVQEFNFPNTQNRGRVDIRTELAPTADVPTTSAVSLKDSAFNGFGWYYDSKLDSTKNQLGLYRVTNNERAPLPILWLDSNGKVTFNSEAFAQTPTLDNHVATKKYVDDHSGGGGGGDATKAYVDQQDTATLTSAKSYTDTSSASTLASGKTYADTGDAATLASAKTFATSGDTTTLTSAKTYSDAGDTATLNAAKAYTDSKPSGGVSPDANGVAEIDYTGKATPILRGKIDSAKTMLFGCTYAGTGGATNYDSIGFNSASRSFVYRQADSTGNSNDVLSVAPSGVAIRTSSITYTYGGSTFSENRYLSGSASQWFDNYSVTAANTYSREIGYGTNKFLTLQNASGTLSVAVGQAMTMPASYTPSLATHVATKAYVDANGSSVSKTYVDTGDANALTSSKSYTDSSVSTTLASAKSYTDTSVANTLTSAKTYADTGDATTLSSAQTYADTGDTNTLNSAKSHSDAGDASTLTQAKAYTDTKSSPIVLDANSIGVLSALGFRMKNNASSATSTVFLNGNGDGWTDTYSETWSNIWSRTISFKTTTYLTFQNASGTITISAAQPIVMSSTYTPTAAKYVATKDYVDLGAIPIGGILDVPSGATLPSNFLLANGSSFNPGIYPTLYSLLGSSVTPSVTARVSGFKCIIRAS